MKYLILMALPLGTVLAAAGAVGQQPAADGHAEDAQVAFSKKLAEREASRYEFCLDDDRKKKLSREPNPVFRWSNPLAGQLYGSVYLWTFHGRPEVVMSVHNWYTNRRLQEAETPAGRLRQVRSLVQEFSASKTVREGGSSQLRLLPQPLYRYKASAPDSKRTVYRLS